MQMLKNPRHECFAMSVGRGVPAIRAYTQIYPSTASNYDSAAVKTTALLKRPEIKDRIAAIRSALVVKDIKYSADDVIQEMFKIGMANMEDFIERDEETGLTRIRKDISREKMAAVSEIIIEDTKFGVKQRVKLHDKRAALVDLGKHFNLFVEKLDVSVKTTNKIEIEALAADERALLKQLLLVANERKQAREAEDRMLTEQSDRLMGMTIDAEYTEEE